MNKIRKASGMIWLFIFLTAFELLVARNLYFYGLAPNSSIGQIFSLLKIFEAQDKEKIHWLVVGDSQSRDGIRPDLVSRELGCDPGSIFNLSINGGKPVDYEYLLQKVIPKLPHLQGVVITVNEHYFERGNVQDDPKFRFLGSLRDKMLVPGPERKADLFLSWAWYSYGMHRQWWEIVKMIVPGSRPSKELIAYQGGLPPLNDTPEEHKTKKYAENLSRSWMLDLRLTGPQVRALERTVNYLDFQDISWVLVHLPKTELMEKTIKEKFPRQEEQFWHFLNNLCARHGKDCYQDFTGITEDCFRDVNHMNDKGAEKLAPQIAEIIKKM